MDEGEPLLNEETGIVSTLLPHEQSFRWHLTRYQSMDAGSVARRTLTTFPGVFSPVALSMFSTVLFLRLGFVVGQAGLVQCLAQLFLAYFILYMTILSICAISTNGAIEGGGAYFMISRALGPEFGGSIGLLFFLANIVSCALYISGFVEGMLDNFGLNGSLLHSGGLPVDGRWWSYLYCTVVLLFCLIICLIGGAMFARTSAFILLVLCVAILSVIGSLLFEGPKSDLPYPHNNHDPFHNASDPNSTARPPLNFTGLSSHTFLDNINSNYTVDYNTGKVMDFASVFAVLFSSVTGIMNGANMSGELKDPGRAIPRGTLTATLFTLVTYLLLCFLTTATCTRELLINNYNYLQPINFWPPFIAIGIFAATLSAALGNLIGASRVLEALAKDEIFWNFLKPATITSRRGNPYVSVFISWGLVQLVLLIGSLNAIAPVASELFLLSYAATNLACLALGLASAPNFRPTFTFFTWHTCALGLIGCIVMCFLISPVYASVSIVVCMVLAIVLHLRTFPQDWGSISQALIFHQVRKYLLMLDSRKDHIKFWRPQMLLMVSNPRSCCGLIDFINDIKKGGLYVLGQVKVGTLDETDTDPCQKDYISWLKLVDQLKIKAFVEVTLARSIREGLHQLVRLSGLGGMKPNTVCLGFYDNSPPEDTFQTRRGRNKRRTLFYTSEAWGDDLMQEFPELRLPDGHKKLAQDEYINMVGDIFKMSKNLCIFRHFYRFHKEEIFKKKKQYIDVWPINLFLPESANYFDTTCLFMLQLACILRMVPGWKTSSLLRIFMCSENQNDATTQKEKKVAQILKQLRIPGVIKPVSIEHATTLLKPPDLNESSGMGSTSSDDPFVSDHNVNEEYIKSLNELIRSQCDNTSVVFLYLPKVPPGGHARNSYLSQLELLTNDIPPTVFVHGVHPVTSTTL